MSDIPGKNQPEQLGLASRSRRAFMASTTTAVAGIGAANLLGLQTARAADAGSAAGIGDGPYPAEGMAAYAPTGPHKPMKFKRRALGPKDVAIKIHYCGVCHSDIHTIRGDWGKIQYPQIVGHELAGEVVAVGSSASKFKVAVPTCHQKEVQCALANCSGRGSQ
jgi:alcohol dehydrogenase (NADP+)